MTRYEATSLSRGLPSLLMPTSSRPQACPRRDNRVHIGSKLTHVSLIDRVAGFLAHNLSDVALLAHFRTRLTCGVRVARYRCLAGNMAFLVGWGIVRTKAFGCIVYTRVRSM